MKTHLKALVVTILAFLLMVGGYKWISSRNSVSTETPVSNTTPMTMPDSDMTLLDGKKINIKFFTGKVVIFNFWASWCSPCIEEVPSLVSLVKADPNIVVVAVSGDQNKDDIYAFLKSFPDFNKAPIYVVQAEADALTKQFNVEKLPESYIFNTKGEMVKKITGTINWHTSDSLEYFKSLR
ncbi:MAG: TlpA family protein disulfide reductase [Bdellovibrionaceae bacterium]|nr:TlpA family protein disulfide reductase [Pseudobdellovibrionaceae bacterium]